MSNATIIFSYIYIHALLFVPNSVTSHGYHGISNHRQLHCLLNRLFRHTPKKIAKLLVSGFCEGNPLSGGLSSQGASNTENVSIWWCLHARMMSLPPRLRENVQYVLNADKNDLYLTQWYSNFRITYVELLNHLSLRPEYSGATGSIQCPLMLGCVTRASTAIVLAMYDQLVLVFMIQCITSISNRDGRGKYFLFCNVTFHDTWQRGYFRVQRTWLMASYWSLDAPNSSCAQPEALSFLRVCRYILMACFSRNTCNCNWYCSFDCGNSNVYPVGATLRRSGLLKHTSLSSREQFCRIPTVPLKVACIYS